MIRNNNILYKIQFKHLARWNTADCEILFKNNLINNLKKQQNGSNLIFQIGNSKFILRIFSQSLEISYVEFLKDPF